MAQTQFELQWQGSRAHPACASLWGSPEYPVFFIAHPYNKASLLRRPDRGSISCSLLPHNLAFFLAPLIMNLSNVSIHLLIQELFNAYCVPGTTTELWKLTKTPPRSSSQEPLPSRERLGLHTPPRQKELPVIISYSHTSTTFCRIYGTYCLCKHTVSYFCIMIYCIPSSSLK